ncbi:uncharacterized protein FIBRA_06703 [Fibroporia radiculosa]|uniref:Polysaccharide lyase 14 domain-containing protein n=1 Tax=Fibroporia radiculosa TaxID=599839 RepID=J4HZI7_9APHY|nr:uncharacterized protein FIBRA_06703 [Fibroporia radiculosa]CCM04522.1 predicted protein [Fibroporia radiculosa]
MTSTAPPFTTTVSGPPVTVTEVITVPPLPPATTAETAWTAPAQMTDLAAFNITNFASGQQNLHIVPDAPASSNQIGLAIMDDGNSSLSIFPQQNSTAALQLLYPADSIDPANDPQGGADFYATPLDLHNAQSVSLEYSVFFPVDFDWVQGGKLPGIYGGHTGCSGGDAAVTCFSTRLMWRAGGAGELYLYAPKDKQTKALCSTPPLSICDAAYGLSIGRGSFSFTPGAWTHVQQTVSLNTPGEQDGGFVLYVNGNTVINRTDVYYRDNPADGSEGDDSDGDDNNDDSQAPDGSSSGQATDGGSLLGGLLGNFVRVAFWPTHGMLILRNEVDYGVPEPSLALASEGAFSGTAGPALVSRSMSAPQLNSTLQIISVVTLTSIIQMEAMVQTLTPSVTSTITLYPTPNPTNATFGIEQVPNRQPVKFTGLFFSTFFGGHDPDWASPKDQYTWFKDFSMTINN